MYSWGGLATSQYDGMTFFSVNRTIDKNTGLVSQDTDPAGVATTFTYDVAGRVKTQTTAGLAPTTYTYTSAVSSGTAAAATAAASQSGAGATGARTSKFTFDGFGRVVREVTNGDVDGVLRGHDTQYDAAGRKSAETTMGVANDANIPYPPSTKTTSVYDFAGRPTEIKTPDNSITTFAYTGIRKVQRTVKVRTLTNTNADSTTVELHDALGRLTSVDEPFGPAVNDHLLATYGYDIADRLIAVDLIDKTETTPPARTPQQRVFTYDRRGFLLSEQHPEIGGTGGNGTIEYSFFDPRGHARRKTTGAAYGASDVVFHFDQGERLTAVGKKTSATAEETLKSFVYGDTETTNPVKSAGKIFKATRLNKMADGSIITVEDQYAYHATSGLPTSKTTTVAKGATTLQTFTQPYSHTAFGELVTIGYPAVSASGAPSRTLTGFYRNGFLIGVDQFSGKVETNGSITAGISYHPTGAVYQVKHADGTTDTYLADDNGMPRIGGITFSDIEGCTPPATPSIAAAATACPASTANTASVPFDATVSSYVWTISGGTITSGQSTSSITYTVTAAAGGNVHLGLTVSKTCGTANASVDVGIVADRNTTITAPASVPPSSTGNTASVPQVASTTYGWSVTGGTISGSAALAAITFTAGASGTVHLTVSVTNDCGTSTDSRDVSVGSPPAAPASVDAYASSTSSVHLTWPPVSGAIGYRILRAATRSADLAGAWTIVADTGTTPTFDDLSVSENTSYLYRVKAIGSGGVLSAASPFDIATTVIFTDDANHIIRAEDVTKMRRGVHALCVAAEVNLLSQCTFTGALASDGVTQPSGTPILRVHLADLRSALDASRSTLGLSAVPYDETVANASRVRLQHVIEIRGGVR
jgi:YD repeat-containing protein